MGADLDGGVGDPDGVDLLAGLVTLLASARTLGRLVGGGELDEDNARAILLDALRTNDVRLVAAAAGGRYAAAELTDAELAQALLKCLFVGVPLAGVPALARLPRDAARMAADLARERVAAGRDVPPDAWLLLDPYPGVLDDAGLPAELDSPDPHRRAAARRFLASRPSRMEG